MTLKSLGGLAAAREGAGGGKRVHSLASSVRDLLVHPIEMMGLHRVLTLQQRL